MASQSDVQDFLSKVSFYVYWILGMLLVGGGSYFLYNRMNKQVAGVLVFMAGVIALYFYYVKWFLSPESQWPPVGSVTTCPDFLTVAGRYDDPTDSKKAFIYCKDYVGVGATGLSKSNIVSEQNPITDKASGDAAVTAGYAIKIPYDTEKGVATSYCASMPKGLTWISFCDAM